MYFYLLHWSLWPSPGWEARGRLFPEPWSVASVRDSETPGGPSYMPTCRAPGHHATPLETGRRRETESPLQPGACLGIWPHTVSKRGSRAPESVPPVPCALGRLRPRPGPSRRPQVSERCCKGPSCPVHPQTGPWCPSSPTLRIPSLAWQGACPAGLSSLSAVPMILPCAEDRVSDRVIPWGVKRGRPLSLGPRPPGVLQVGQPCSGSGSVAPGMRGALGRRSVGTWRRDSDDSVWSPDLLKGQMVLHLQRSYL